MINVFGLIGYPLSHSRSPEIYRRLFREYDLNNYSYRLFPIADLTRLNNLLTDNPDLQGFNVTIPYKEKVIDYLDVVDDLARDAGAVNTVTIRNIKEKRTKVVCKKSRQSCQRRSSYCESF